MTSKILLISMMIIMGGCASYRDVYKERFDSLPQRYSQFDLKIAWETKVTESGTVVEGVVKNARYFEMTGVEIWVSLLDNNGRTLGRSASFIIPRSLREYDTAPFSLTLPVRAQPGMKLQFTYRYRKHEGHDENDFWMQSFEVGVPVEK